MSGVPGWQTEELQDEWPEEEEEQAQDEDEDEQSYGTQDVSLTIPLSSQIHSTADFQPDKSNMSGSSHAVGTFVVRDDVPDVPILAKTPGRNKKFFGKDFFTPLQLETMFEPPSPPTEESPNSNAHPTSMIVHSFDSHNSGNSSQDEIVETDMPNMNSFHGKKAAMACQFTFRAPLELPLQTPGRQNIAFPLAQSTPHPNATQPSNHAPPTDPRLKLFQFQYDTYTREHLSALVDSIAVNTPSGTGTGASGTPTSFGPGLPRILEAPPPASHLRSSKRIKLSPNVALDEAEENPAAKATISRPRRDYVGESRSLMQQIKLAKDYSTISTVASGQKGSPADSDDTPQKSRAKNARKANLSPSILTRRRSLLSVPQESGDSTTPSGSINSKVSSYSSTSYRQKAAALMEQIKSDVKRQKRALADDSESSHITTHVDETATSVGGSATAGIEGKENLRQSTSSRRSSTRFNSPRSSRTSPRRASKRGADEAELVREVSRISITQQQPIVNIFLNPPMINIPSLPAQTGRSRRSPSTLAPPPYPSVRLTSNEDLNRFVSSSTASGTTLTAGSVPSFTKHSGPAHIRTIAPADLPTLPEQFGDMLFDKVMMRWVKNTARAMGHERSVSHVTDASEDPFGDIESLRDDSRVEHHIDDREETANSVAEMSKIEEQSEVEDEEEMELSNFSTDASAHIVEIMTGVETADYEDETTDSESTNDDIHTATQAVVNDIDFDSEFEDSPSRNNLTVAEIVPSQTGRSISNPAPTRSPNPHTSSTRRSPHRRRTIPQPHQLQHHHHQLLAVDIPATTTRALSPVPGQASGKISPAALATPNRGTSASITTPVIKSVLKSNSATPTSALKHGIRSRFQTPVSSKLYRRSVSFSDGKREGPMRDIDYSLAPSMRTKRIADMVAALEESSDLEDSPSKSSSSGRPDELQPLTSRRPSMSLSPRSGNVEGQSPRRVFSRSYAQRSSQSPGSRRDISSNAKANGTFLTECSFAVAHDRLVQVITDVQPFEPHWEQLATIDLSNAKLESVARLKEFLPQLDTLVLNQNELAWLSGIPGSVRTLSVAFNCLTGITSYSHLNNLENLDISNNEVDSLRQLQCLRHLRELKADGNKITSLDGLERMDGLVKLSVEGNKIQAVDLNAFCWSRLELLNLSHNRIHDLQGLAMLQTLIACNLDMNALPSLPIASTMSRLRILRVSGNSKLKTLDVGKIPNVRTLYADNCSFGLGGDADVFKPEEKEKEKAKTAEGDAGPVSISNEEKGKGKHVARAGGLRDLKRLTRLENLSLRNQGASPGHGSANGINLLTRDIRDVKRLYLSGNPLSTPSPTSSCLIPKTLLSEPCYTLIYLELAACRLTSLPPDLSTTLPNLRVLNLNYNFLEDVKPLEGLKRLQKLSIIGSRLKNTKPLISVVEDMRDAEMLDFRMNPCTLGWYLPLLVKDVPAALQPCEGGKKATEKKSEQGWQELDVKFRRDLPDEAYIGRLAYRGLIMRGCLGLKMLDGVGVSEKERMKADKLLSGLLGGKRTGSKSSSEST